jgi:hypothetical protein
MAFQYTNSLTIGLKFLVWNVRSLRGAAQFWREYTYFEHGDFQYTRSLTVRLNFSRVKFEISCEVQAQFSRDLWEQMAEFLQSRMRDHCEVRLIFRDNKFWSWWLSIYKFTYSWAKFLKSQMVNPLRSAALLRFRATCERKWLNFSRVKCEILIWCSSVSKKLVRENEGLWPSLDMNDPSQVLWWIQVPLTALQIGQVLKSLPI